jgi:hypothetical protein
LPRPPSWRLVLVTLVGERPQSVVRLDSPPGQPGQDAISTSADRLEVRSGEDAEFFRIGDRAFLAMASTRDSDVYRQ